MKKLFYWLLVNFLSGLCAVNEDNESCFYEEEEKNNQQQHNDNIFRYLDIEYRSNRLVFILVF